MRVAVLALLACVVVSPASAASIEPRNLVFAAAAVPAGFQVDPKETGLRTNERDIREFPSAREYFTRWERLIGYQAAYRRGSARIESRSDVFRAARGAYDAAIADYDRRRGADPYWDNDPHYPDD